MAYGYAVLHWGARFDGRGIEFLLGCTESSQVKLHMLDFEDCKPFVCWSKEGIRNQLVPAAMDNAPYIPRPFVSPDLWRAFKKAYLAASRVILKTSAGFGVWDDAEEEVEASLPRTCHLCGSVFPFRVGYSNHPLNGCELEGERDGDYYDDADVKIRKLPRYFIRELRAALFEQDAEENASGVSSNVANEDY